MQPKNAVQAAVAALSRAPQGIVRVMKGLFGSIQWQPPQWVRFVWERLRVGFSWVYIHPARFMSVIGVLAMLVIGGQQGLKWWNNRPKPVEMSVRLDAPEATKLEDNAKPDNLRVVFGGSAAPIDKVKKNITEGIELEPMVPGTWRWDSDRILVFTPKEDWPVGEAFHITLKKKKLLAENVRLEKYELEFQSAPLTATLDSTEFFQDPQDQSVKKVVSTVKFSHPIDTAEFEKRLSLELFTLKAGAWEHRPYRFQVSYDKLHGSAFVHSDPVPLPDHNGRMEIRIAAGLRTPKGGKPTTKPLSTSVDIPGIYDFLHISEASLTLVNNAQYEPEQVLLLETNTGVTEAEMKKAISAYVLPVRPLKEATPQKEQYSWGTYEISNEVLKASTPLKLEQIPNEREFATTHSFRFQADVGRMVYVKVAKGLRSFGGYILFQQADYALRVPEYPKELKIMQNGALLSLSGEKKVSLYARDVEAVRVELSRLLPGQLHHLVDQNNGSFQTPEFYNYRFNFDNISEVFSDVISLPSVAHGKAQYAAVDLGKYLEGRGEDRRGIFYLKVESWDKDRRISTGKTEYRLVMLTDLGLLVKDNSDGTHDVFVQSLSTGEPVKGAHVEVIGKNGLAIASDSTGADGHVTLPKLTDFVREKAPLLYLVRKASDTSFLPWLRQDRYLNFSRFAIDGVTNSEQPQGLTAYLFSDRGIYRPGDEIRVGLVVKSRDWKQKLLGVPLEVTVDDARGVTVRREKIRLSESGFEEIRYTTAEASPTGTWNVNVHVVKDDRADSLLGSVAVRVQEFLPDRLKMTATLSKDSVEGWVSPQDLKARISLQNLFGTPATERRIKASISLSPTLPTFSKFRDYQFSDPLRAKESFNDSLAEGETDENGASEFELDLTRFTSATYRLRFIAQGFESEGGRSVSAEASVTVSPLEYLLGFKADGELSYIGKGSRRHVDLIAIGPSAARITKNGVRALLLERKYLSVLTKQYNGTYKYESIRKELPVADKHINIPEPGLKYDLPTDRAGDFVLVLKNDKDQELNRIEFSIAGDGNLSRSLEKNAELQVQLKSADVGPGEEIEMQIKAPYTGAGLITIERDKVLTHKWFVATTTASVQKIRVPDDMEGNGYVSVAFIRGIDSNDVFMSPLSYGIAPFSLSRARRTAKITVSSPDLVKPGEPLKLRYATDRPTKIVLFAVDEGILQVAHYKTPDPLAFFFQKRALEVKTAQILDLILPEYSRLMAAAPGGDGEGGAARNLNPFKRRRDKPVAYWSGIIDAGPKEREVVYQVPDSFNGTLRVMAVAVAADAVGVLQKKATVRGDFVLSPNAPVVVAPGDQFEVSVGVANNIIGSGKSAAVALELKTSKHLEIVGSAKQSLTIGELRETSAVYTLRATQLLGSGSLTFVASHGGKSGKYTVDLSVRPATPHLTTTAIGQLAAGGGKQVVPVPRSMYSEYRVLSAGVSPLPLILTQGLMQYLEKYPHGCTEQQISQAFPAVVLKTRLGFGQSPEAADKMFAAVVQTLRARQNDEGGFGLWQNPNPVSDYASVYAMHFLVESKERGFPIPPELWKKGLEYLGQLAGRETDTLAGERLRSYAVYILTRSGIVTSQYVSSVQKTLENSYKDWKKDVAGVYLAATLKLLKQDRAAAKLVADVNVGQQKDYDYLNFYDPLTRDAQVLYLLARHFPERLKLVATGAIQSMIAPVVENRFNTLSASYAILALDAYAQAAEGLVDVASLGISEILGDDKVRPLTLPQSLLPTVRFTPDAKKLLVSSSSPLPTFYQVTQAGFDLSVPSQPVAKRLEVLREFMQDGKPVTQVKVGDEIEVHIKLRALDKTTLSQLALVDLLPGGFEVVIQSTGSAASSTDGDGDDDENKEDKEGASDSGEGGEGGEGGGDGDGEGGSSSRTETAAPTALPITLSSSTWTPDYGDVREDRVVLYGTINDSVKEYVYSMKATNVGTFTVPPLQGEGMYDRTIIARSTGSKLTVTK